MTRPTIYDVARESGFSIKTVSRVINGAPNVRRETVARVQAAIDLLQYHPDPAAQRLGGGKLPTVGVVVDSIDDPFFAQVVAVIEGRAMDVGMDVLVASTGMDESRMRTQIQRLARRGVAGLVVAPFGDERRVAEALPDEVPVVVIDRKCGVTDKDVVRVTDEEGAVEAVRHLAARGHRRIGFLGKTSAFTTLTDRYVGYEKALAEAGLEVDPRIVETRAWSADEGYPHALAMLATADAPTAVFAASPMMGLAILRAQQRLHRQDIAVVIFGDHPAADLMTPPTTVVDQRPTALAEAAFDLLSRRIQDPDAEVLDMVMPTMLLARGSGELAPRSLP
ncbi:LacI family DNA-binding transcriptional regulator [Phycicoccus endophyticus]|uniref:LacI family DNA-binding transcriptional regulator n=1 Tax=Phycicoccus endophyticus TaxID=1690220 RepID=A0A7G9R2Y7_9MICO|nr:LacI family DNA-binding transcriptional regulator [Phycicoccus endophyticus]NHI20253.1 LacI family transcriptional regulator [Phycicoccus endophyticus]QNN49962.1 LacI family DNA-binding transcriptional regulator [Phycicoccus endophyticus]GGL29241.1 LacI family transcriptional regulator [Phycicoccus endophyticus]